MGLLQKSELLAHTLSKFQIDLYLKLFLDKRKQLYK